MDHFGSRSLASCPLQVCVFFFSWLALNIGYFRSIIGFTCLGTQINQVVYECIGTSLCRTLAKVPDSIENLLETGIPTNCGLIGTVLPWGKTKLRRSSNPAAPLFRAFWVSRGPPFPTSFCTEIGSSTGSGHRWHLCDEFLCDFGKGAVPKDCSVVVLGSQISIHPAVP